ncbi:MAG: hypothetical protein M3Q14_01700 [bacterium]|nr:hypothetical protein [bacterium]
MGLLLNKSFERAVFDGDISGPDWHVVSEDELPIYPGRQSFGHTNPGQNVGAEGSECIKNMIDFQFPFQLVEKP